MSVSLLKKLNTDGLGGTSGGGFIVGEPGAIAAGVNAVGRDCLSNNGRHGRRRGRWSKAQERPAPDSFRQAALAEGEGDDGNVMHPAAHG